MVPPAIRAGPRSTIPKSPPAQPRQACSKAAPGAGQEFARGTGIGARRLWRGQPLTSDKIRLPITRAAACPALAGIAVYLEPQAARGHWTRYPNNERFFTGNGKT